MGNQRGETLACMILDASKTITEGDAEVSEAIDFARYYAESASEWLIMSNAKGEASPPNSENGTLERGSHKSSANVEPVGVVVIAPPWNFPYAIPAGGVLAVLAMGNSVILKPATETVPTAWMLANQLWQAGVPRDVLQFLPCPDNEVGQKLITDDRVGAVVLTGAWSTARMFQRWKPTLNLFAETSGKNGLIAISALATAIKPSRISFRVPLAMPDRNARPPVWRSSKRKSTMIPASCAQLRDAARSLIVGSAWDPATSTPALIREPGDDLRPGLTQLDPGEAWLLEPRMIDGNPCLWTPGVRLGVKPVSGTTKRNASAPSWV